MIMSLALPENLKTIDLDTLQQLANFQERKDLKFLLPTDKIPAFWQALQPNHRLLTNNTTNWFSYQTVYYDTQAMDCYLNHHQGKGNRFKIRVRKYLNSDSVYLEIKQRNVHGITHKHREIFHSSSFNDWILPFTAGVSWNHFNPILSMDVDRQTWVKENGLERITIDCNLAFQPSLSMKSDEINVPTKRIHYPQWAIIEIKSYKSYSELTSMLLRLGAKFNSLSKYCWAVSALNIHPKKNLFLPHLKYLNNHNPAHELATL